MRLATFTAAMSALITGLCGLESEADPLHKIGTEGAWQHEGSGWLFPKRILDAERVGVPYTIDGNEDVGVAYEIPLDGRRATATVEVYRADSAAIGAQLDHAETVQSAAAPGAALRLRSQAPFTVSEQPTLVGTKVQNTQHSLYYVKTPEWVVVIRSTDRVGYDLAALLDDFVRALPWDTLGTDTIALHGSGH